MPRFMRMTKLIWCFFASSLCSSACSTGTNTPTPAESDATSSSATNESGVLTSTVGASGGSNSVGSSGPTQSTNSGGPGSTGGNTDSNVSGLPTTTPSTNTQSTPQTTDEVTSSDTNQGTNSTTAETTTTNVDSSSTSDVPSEPEVRFIGRFAKDGEQAAFAWSGSGVVAAFEGTEVSVQLDDSGSNQFTVVVDGQVQPVLKAQAGSGTYLLAEGLSAGRHEVEIYRRTEANQGVTTFEGFDFGATGVLLAPPTPKLRRLEVIGDSISCGYGNEGADTSCTFSADTENHYLTYGAIAARTLEAELSTVAWSGKGVVNNYDTDTTNPMPTLYNRVLPDDANSRWDFSVKPHAVIINLGTNDFSTDGDPTTEQFRDGYIGLIEQVREGAPDAFILCTVGNMLTGADLDAARAGIHAAVDAVQALGDDQIAAWDMNVPNEDPGCDWHPKVATHELMADALVVELKQYLGW